MNQTLHGFSEQVLIRALEEYTKEFWNSITFGGQRTCLKKKARTEE